MNSPFDGAINVARKHYVIQTQKFLACAKSLMESWPENRLLHFFLGRYSVFFLRF